MSDTIYERLKFMPPTALPAVIDYIASFKECRNAVAARSIMEKAVRLDVIVRDSGTGKWRGNLNWQPKFFR